MDTLTELYNTQIVPLDEELEKEAAVMVKQAEEEEFAGRIMARGFADELNKLAAPFAPGGTNRPPAGPSGQISQPRRGKTPMAEAPREVSFSKNEGSKIKARPAAPKQTRAQAVGHAKGIANMAKGIGNIGGAFGAKKPAAPARVAGGPPKL